MNFDQTILEAKTVDENATEAVLHQILRIAAYDEYHAYETYNRVIQVFGPVRPFINIVEAEQRHIQEIAAVCQRYQVMMPVNDWIGKITVPDTFTACCQMGVEAEIENIAMYDHLLNYSEFADVTDLFYRLQAASFNNHLPAFRACAAMGEMGEQPGNRDWYQLIEQFVGRDIKNLLPEDVRKIFDSENKDILLGALLGAALVYFIDQSGSKSEDKE